MKNSVAFLFLILALLSSASQSHGAITFSLARAPSDPPGDIPVGSNAVFDVFIQSSVANQSVLIVDFDISASDAGGAGGAFVSGTNELPGNGGYFPGTFPTTSASFSADTLASINVGTTPTWISQITLGTVAATPGTYFLSLSSLNVQDGSFNRIDVINGGNLSYTITAVPEPGSIALFSMTMCAGVVGMRRARRNARPV